MFISAFRALECLCDVPPPTVFDRYLQCFRYLAIFLAFVALHGKICVGISRAVFVRVFLHHALQFRQFPSAVCGLGEQSSSTAVFSFSEALYLLNHVSGVSTYSID
jgi:hypothetical protein